MTKDEALKLALEALNRGESKLRWEAIAAIEEALAQPEQEQLQPVWNGGPTNKDVEDALRLKRLNQLATPPKRAWVGLTEEDFSAINQSCLTKLQAATSAESILKKKNT